MAPPQPAPAQQGWGGDAAGGAASSGAAQLGDGRSGDGGGEALVEGGTLVVCPTSVLHQWARELADKIIPDAGVTWHVYHGRDKEATAKALGSYTMVLTTFGTMAVDAPSKDKMAARVRKQGSAAAPIVLCDDDLDDDDGDDGESAGVGGAAPAGRPPRPPAGGARRSAAGGGALYGVAWHRVVLDEAQSIKNIRTLTAHAAAALVARHRWCLSGTPVQNSIDDLLSYFRFLRYEPFCHPKRFKLLVKDEIARDPERGFRKLQTLLQAILLRRTKQTKLEGQPIVQLPARTQHMLKATFNPADASFYRRIEADAQRQLEELRGQQGGRGSGTYIGMLYQLLRLRQACNHPWLVRAPQDGDAGGAGAALQRRSATPSAGEVAAARRLPPEKRALLLAAARSSSADTQCCMACGDLPEDVTVTVCAHVLCRQCVAAQIEAGGGEGEFVCGSCGGTVKATQVWRGSALEVAEAGDGGGDGGGGGEADGGGGASRGRGGGSRRGSGHGRGRGGAGPSGPGTWVSSTKVDKLLTLLDSIRKGTGVAAAAAAPPAAATPAPGSTLSARSHTANLMARQMRRPSAPPPPRTTTGQAEKAIVFSQWTGFLDLLEGPLRAAQHTFRRLDGSMGVAARERAISDFVGREDVTVLLVSLKAAALGLNLVAANHVVLMDLWWNPTTEEQAIDRAHRIGQTREVHVTRITIPGTVEDRILELQDKKRKVVAAALSADVEGGGVANRLSLEDLHFLFGVAP